MPSPQWGLPARLTAAILLIIFFIYLLYLMGSVLQSLIIAALIAFMLSPWIRYLNETLYLPKLLAVIIAHILLIIFIVLMPLLVVPSLIDAFRTIDVNVVTLAEQMRDWAKEMLMQYRVIEVRGMQTDLSPFVDPVLEVLEGIHLSRFIPSLDRIVAAIPLTVEITWGVASGFLGRVFSGLFAFSLTILCSIYLCYGIEGYLKSLSNLLPTVHRPELTELGRRLRDIWNDYFRGQLNLGIIIGLLTWITGTLIGLPGAFALGVIAGVLEILPGIGPFLAAVPAVIMALVQGSDVLSVSNLTFMLIVLAQYIIIQQLENNLIVPKILGEAVELDPLVVMVGVIVGAGVGGILGALIAAPTIASWRTIILYTYAKILGEDPFPPEEDKGEPFSIIDTLFGIQRKFRALIDKSVTGRRGSSKRPRKSLKA